MSFYFVEQYMENFQHSVLHFEFFLHIGYDMPEVTLALGQGWVLHSMCSDGTGKNESKWNARSSGAFTCYLSLHSVALSCDSSCRQTHLEIAGF